MLGMSSTCISRHIDAPRAAVYRALLDPHAVAAWRVPTGMTSRVHEFDPREGGSFRISLTYEVVKLVADRRVVEVVEFETTDPALRGEMTITTTLVDSDGGTDVVVAYEGLPRGLPTADNETGTRMALAKLAALAGCRRCSRSMGRASPPIVLVQPNGSSVTLGASAWLPQGLPACLNSSARVSQLTFSARRW